MLSITTLTTENLVNVSTECFSHHQGKIEEVQTIYSHVLLRIYIIRGQRSVRISLLFRTYWQRRS